MKKRSSLLLPAVVAGLASVISINTASADFVFVTDNGANVVDAYASAGSSPIVYATAGLNGPTGLAFDSSDDLFVANNGDGTIQEFAPGGGSLGTYATGLVGARGLVIDDTASINSGDLFVVNQGTGTIDKFTAPNTSTVFASGLNAPTGLAIDSSGDLFVSESGSGIIDEIAPDGTVSSFATGLSTPTGLAVSGGNLFVVQRGTTPDETIEEINISTKASSIFSSVGISNADGLAADSSGNLYVANPGDGTITAYDSSSAESLFASDLSYPCFVTTLANGGTVINDTPEPSTYALLAAGLGALLFMSRRKTVTARI